MYILYILYFRVASTIKTIYLSIYCHLPAGKQLKTIKKPYIRTYMHIQYCTLAGLPPTMILWGGSEKTYKLHQSISRICQKIHH